MALDLSSLTVGSTGWGPPLLAGLTELDGAKVNKGALVANVMDYGALGNGIADDTAAIQAAINASSAVYLPPGTYNVNATLTTTRSNASLFGAGFGTIVSTSSATNDVFSVSGVMKFTLSDLMITSSVTRTAGWFVNNASNEFVLRNFVLYNFFGGVRTTGTVVSIHDGYLRNGTTTTGIGFQVDGGFAVKIADVVIAKDTGNMAAGIKVTSTGDLVISRCNIMQAGYSLWIEPASGTAVTSVWAGDTFFDTATRGLHINAALGNVQRLSFNRCWFSSHTTGGVYITGTAGYFVDGVDFIGCHVLFNTGDGMSFLVGGVTKNFRVADCNVAGNTGAGVVVAAGVTDFIITGNRIGPAVGSGTASSWGVYIDTGASDHYIVTSNDLHGNTAGAIADGGSGTHKVVTNNLSA